jgi:signal transduction histidine kinase
VAAEIVRLHKGKIDVESQKGKGSTFKFSIPIR